ncbi:hypothetical protein [Moorena sp. SIO3I6]|nr:hypothetical protein [Moorena sp. SIO3I6]NEP23400.1 hypothetical protein [Moorena sp. SIO3I6]
MNKLKNTVFKGKHLAVSYQPSAVSRQPSAVSRWPLATLREQLILFKS